MSGPRWQAEPLEITADRWARFVAGRPEATPFHHPAWARTIADCYGYRPFALLLSGAGGEQVGLPVIEVRHGPARPRWVSLPFTDHCPPLGDVPVAVLDELRGAAGATRLEVRDELEGAHAGSRSYGHTLALSGDEDAVFGRLHRNQVQRNVRRARREGVRIETSTDEEALIRDFFALHVMTRQRLGVPVQPQRYFRALWDQMIRGGLGFTAVARIGDTPIAAAVFLTYNGTIVYKYGASDPAYWSARANHLMFWEAIAWACRAGFHTFDFGRTGIADQSLREFKSRWGTVERVLTYSVIADQVPSPSRDEVPSAARAVIRRSPALVTRGVGAALYRYTA